MKLVRLLVYTNLWIATGAIALFTAGYTLLGGVKPQVHTLAFLFCATLLTYNLHWLLAGRTYLRQRTDAKYQWYARHYSLGWVLFSLAFLGELWSLYYFSWREFFFFAHLGVIALLYNFPEHRTPQWLISIRRIPFLKIFLIAYLWATLGAGYPALLLNRLDLETVFWFLAVLLYVFAITLPFDVRDLFEDRQRGLKTLPDRWGVRTTKGVALLSLAVASGCMYVAHASPGGISLLTLGATIAIVGTTPHRSELYFTGLIDGLLVAFSLLIWL